MPGTKIDEGEERFLPDSLSMAMPQTVETVADLLVEGLFVGWFEGAAELAAPWATAAFWPRRAITG